MDPFIKFFQQYGAIFQIVQVCLTIVLAVLGIIAYVRYFKKTSVKKEKVKLPKVKAEKSDRYNLVIKDEHNVVVFNQNYKNKLKAKSAISKNIKELRKANKSPKSYKITKIK